MGMLSFLFAHVLPFGTQQKHGVCVKVIESISATQPVPVSKPSPLILQDTVMISPRMNVQLMPTHIPMILRASQSYLLPKLLERW